MRASDHSKALDGTRPRSQFSRRKADSYDPISLREFSVFLIFWSIFLFIFTHAHRFVDTTSTDYRSDRHQQGYITFYFRISIFGFEFSNVDQRGPLFTFQSSFSNNKHQKPTKTFLLAQTGWQPMGLMVRVWRVRERERRRDACLDR